MQLFFVAFNTALSTPKLAVRRRRLAAMLKEHRIKTVTLKVAGTGKTAVSRISETARGCVVVVVDDRHRLPDVAPWLAELTGTVLDLTPIRRPQLIYVTQHADAAGLAQALRHPLVRHYIKRDEGTAWVRSCVEAALSLAAEIRAAAPAEREVAAGPPADAIVGASPVFREAVRRLDQVIQGPCGLVTGERGAGKMFLVRSLWSRHAGGTPLIVLPCGSFFKDYYVGGSRRRFGGGREAIDQMAPYLEEAQGSGLLVLHHVEQLPTAVQQELAVRLSVASGREAAVPRLTGVDADGLAEHDTRIIGTSNHPPDQLRLTGRLIEDLADKLCRHHVTVPSLRQRGPEDVRLLCRDVLARIAHRRGLPKPPRLERAVERRLAATHWPGNVSDLLKVLEHAVDHCQGGMIRKRDLPRQLPSAAGASQSLDAVIAEAQRTAIEAALEATGGNVSKAAAILARNPSALHRLMKKLGIPRRRRLG